MVTAEFNPLSPETLQDPYPTYRDLLKHNPVSWNPMLEVWMYTRFEDVDAILMHPKGSAERWRGSNRIAQLQRAQMEQQNPDLNLTPTMLTSDPPEHTRLRRLVSKAFTPRAVEDLRPRIQNIVDFLLDDVADNGEMDLVQALAYPLPVIVIAEMLGVPTEDRADFKRWSDDLVATLGNLRQDPEVTQKALAARNELVDYLTGVIDDRRQNPRDDLISGLVTAEEGGETLSKEDIYSTTILLLVAGNETTTNLIGNSMLALLRNPEQTERLHKDPDLIKSAVEELLRFCGPVQMTSRVVTEEVEIGGQVIKQWESAMAVVGAANHDPAKWGDDASELDITRNPTDHVAFGDGIHFCLGAPLARAEAQIAINSVVQRFPNLALAEPDPKFGGTFIIRGVKNLPLTF
jgi:cytochrome P450